MMLVFRSLLVTAAALAVASLSPGPAAAAGGQDVTYWGHTSQGRRIRVDSDTTGRVPSVAVWWRAPCRRPRARVHTPTYFSKVNETAGATRIAQSGSYTGRYVHGVRIRFTVALRGHKASSLLWRGTYRARAVVRRRGRVIDHCRLRPVSWRAATTRAYAEFHGGFPYPTPEDVTLATPADRFSLRGDAHGVSGHAHLHGMPRVPGYGEYFFAFDASPGRRLTTGSRFSHGRDPAWHGRRPGVSVTGGDEGCNRKSGHFRVLRARYAPNGHVTLFAVRFVARCDGAPVTGVLRWRRPWS